MGDIIKEGYKITITDKEDTILDEIQLGGYNLEKAMARASLISDIHSALPAEAFDPPTGNPMITDVDTCLKDIADFYIQNKREMTEPELESILLKHCGSEKEIQKFAGFLKTKPGQLRFKTILIERKARYGSR